MSDKKIHPEGYSRLPYDKTIETRTQNLDNSKVFSLKGITRCYDLTCQSTNIAYDSNRDEVYCKDCGTVLRQGFTDNQDIILKALKNETLSEQYNNPVEIKSDNEIYTEYYNTDKATA